MKKMFRKTLLFVLAAVMVFGCFAFAGCENKKVRDLLTRTEKLEEKLEQLQKDKDDLADENDKLKGELESLSEQLLTATELAIAKIEAEIEIKNYAYLEECSDEYWGIVYDFIEDFETELNEATNKDEIAAAVNQTKAWIDEVLSEDTGILMGIQRAYDAGMITVADLEALAEIYNSKTVPENTLDKVTEISIKKTYRTINFDNAAYALLEGIHINRYYGMYSGSIAVDMHDDYIHPDVITFPEYVVGGVTFYNYGSYWILIWNRNVGN